MKIFLATLNEPQEFWEGDGLIARISMLLRHSHRHYEVNCAEEADVVVFLESNRFKSRHNFDLFSNTELLRQWCHKAFTINYSDYPVALLPGLYVSLPQQSFDNRWTRAIPPTSPLVYPKPKGVDISVEDVRFDLSFRGALSHPVRARLVEFMKSRPDLGPCQVINRWYDHTPDEQLDYIQEISRSKFVLCPRGLGVSSYRIYETLQMGRVPIVISDDWIPPAGIDWQSCALRIAEDRINELPDLLRSALSRWRHMSAAATKVWREKLMDEVLADTLFDQLETLFWLRNRNLRWNDLVKRWKSSAFRRQNGWDLANRVKRQFRRKFTAI